MLEVTCREAPRQPLDGIAGVNTGLDSGRGSGQGDVPSIGNALRAGCFSDVRGAGRLIVHQPSCFSRTRLRRQRRGSPGYMPLPPVCPLPVQGLQDDRWSEPLLLILDDINAISEERITSSLRDLPSNTYSKCSVAAETHPIPRMYVTQAT